MRRTTFDKLLGWIGASLGIGLLAIGGPAWTTSSPSTSRT
jgi:hypothetical protein